MITIYHNPHCSKSREALALAEEFAAKNKLMLEVVDYQKTRLTLEELKALHEQLDCPVSEMVRKGEEEFAALNLAEANDEACLEAVALYPKLLQRPIVEYCGKAVIGRPTENLRKLFETDVQSRG
ncbi:arsenate reductase (glutaredoxin) [soil metagenome]